MLEKLALTESTGSFSSIALYVFSALSHLVQAENNSMLNQTNKSFSLQLVLFKPN